MHKRGVVIFLVQLLCVTVVVAQIYIPIEHVSVSIVHPSSSTPKHFSSISDNYVISWFSHESLPNDYDGTLKLSLNSTLSPYSTFKNMQTSKVGGGYLHSFELNNMEFATRYYYRLGSEKYGFHETVYSFLTASNGVSKNQNVDFLLVGDMGTTHSHNNIAQLTKQLEKSDHNIAASIILGDISYADDWPGFMYNEVWNKFLSMVEPVSARAPYLVLPGNHDMECKSTHVGCPKEAKNFYYYNSRFIMPHHKSLNHNMWYSVDIGPIHWVSFSSETDYKDAPFSPSFGDQLSFLKKDLAEANKNRNVRPWIIAMAHRPIYSSMIQYSKSGIPIQSAKAMQAQFENILHEYGVDLFFVGHVHSYERTFPVYNNTVVSKSYDNANATVYIVNGSGGNIEGNTKSFEYYNTTFGAFHYVADQGYGLLSAQADDASTFYSLKWSFYAATDNHLLDTVTLRKSKSRYSRKM